MSNFCKNIVLITVKNKWNIIIKIFRQKKIKLLKKNEIDKKNNIKNNFLMINLYKLVKKSNN